MLNISYTTSQSEESVNAASYPFIYLNDTDYEASERHLEASIRHLEECSVCIKQTSSLTSENSTLQRFHTDPNPEWPAPVLHARPQFFQPNLSGVSRPSTLQMHLNCHLSPQVNSSSQCSSSSPAINNLKISPCSLISSSPRIANPTPLKNYTQLHQSSPKVTCLPIQQTDHSPASQALHPLIFTETGTQTDLHISNGISNRTTAKLMLGVVLSAVGVVSLIFIMKCKFKIGFQMNFCYYM